MRCQQCSHEAPADAVFCPRCGAALERLCAHCETPNAPDHAFCKRCGRPFEGGASAPAPAAFASPRAYTPRHLAEKILTARSAIEGEHKQVTVLFCDIT
ncbi:MAG: zinc ribbon domain-containing protein, partial [candidate division NC10 bacterium]